METSKEQKDLLKKIGQLPSKNKNVKLPIGFFKTLTDDEFRVFWALPLNVEVVPKTRRYIEKRSKWLDLTVTDENGFDLPKD